MPSNRVVDMPQPPSFGHAIEVVVGGEHHALPLKCPEQGETRMGARAARLVALSVLTAGVLFAVILAAALVADSESGEGSVVDTPRMLRASSVSRLTSAGSNPFEGR
eukprot:CAMPEP_0203980852 /NCGR_PEP_ID=MMETSP0360-20130528/1805_1 /ASSEMBLY_ACC=CAM_ASM_000342 /TAXON_ID=268821 /ORGANISM="Scrippsiella Hangoei, Strain SHTV-5" /LENGTH=106 /DNA_ID=CAMNT_0050919337 /DNA_START=52 /DNA_END=369 /DNA_ORIENTATION=+